MKFISDEARLFILGKYHDPEKPFNPLRRFLRRDELFPESSGMAPEAIMVKIRELDDSISHLPHPIRKARAFCCILDHTRLLCDPRDPFPAINLIDRPLNKTLVNKWKKEVFESLLPTEISEDMALLNRTGAAKILPDYDHSVPLWDRIFALGFPGLLRESEEARQNLQLDEHQEAFFEGIRITYEGILRFLDRLTEQAGASPGCERMTSALQTLREGPPESFYEALLLDYLYFILCEHMEGLQVRSLCHFDRLLWPFYRDDREKGVTEEAIRQDLAAFFLQFTAIGNYWNQPLYLGGIHADGSTVVNELSWLVLDTYDQMGLYNPKIQIKFSDATPKDFAQKALDMIRRGKNSIVFLGEKHLIEAQMHFGATCDQARTCDIRGCYEYSPQGAMCTDMNYMNMLKPLEYALHRGRDALTGEPVGLPCPDASEFQTFSQFFAEYKRQFAHLTQRILNIVGSFENYLAFINPQNMLSATYPTCLASGRDALEGGAVMNNSAFSFGYTADTADSLTIIEKYVFREKLLTLSELRDILDRNFEGAGDLRLRFWADRDKYGNNRSIPDGFALELMDLACGLVNHRPNAQKRGGEWFATFHVARQSYDQGKVTAATPNGRLRGSELSKNISASMGQNREGPTAAILTATKADLSRIMGAACLDLGLLPGSVKGPEGLEAMYTLVRVFANRGGHALNINVFDAETLRAAQREPEKYRDLQIRVCGWNVLFSNISSEEQDGFIRQAEGLV